MSTIELVGSPDTVGFADGNTGHVYTMPGGAPIPGDYDILCVNSDTVVSTPAGFAAAPVLVATQGSYVFRRYATGGEGSTVTVTTAGNFNTTLTWSRWRYAHLADVAAYDGINGSAGTTTPPVSTGVLASVNELVLAFAPLHGIVGANPTSPVWSAGYTALISGAAQGSGSSSVAAFTGYRLDAGTAAESPSVSWTNSATERYLLLLTFMPKPSLEAAPGGGVGPGGGVAAINPGLVYATGLTGVPGMCAPDGLPATVGTTPSVSALPGFVTLAGQAAVAIAVSVPVPLLVGTAVTRDLLGSATVS